MTKLSKRVAIKKLSYFFKTNQLVLIFHESNIDSFNKNLSSKMADTATLKNISARFIKNTIAEKIIRNINNSNSKESRLSFTDQLFKGPLVILGISEISQLSDILSATRSDKKASQQLLGGFYLNSMLDCRKIEQLAKLESEKQVYLKLLNTLRNPSIQLSCACRLDIKLLSSFQKQHNFIHLLKNLKAKL